MFELIPEMFEVSQNIHYDLELKTAKLLDEVNDETAAFRLLDLQTILRSDEALIIPVVTSMGSAVIIAMKEAKDSSVIWIDQFTKQNLDALLRRPDMAPEYGGWLAAYYSAKSNKTSTTLDRWKMTIDETGNTMWQQLLRPVFEELTQLDIKKVKFAASSGLQLLPLHAVWWMDSKKHYLIDDYEITYIPSMTTLLALNDRVNPDEEKQYSAFIGGVCNYDSLPPLEHVEHEIKAIAKLFNTQPYLDDMVTVDGLVNKTRDVAYIHLACHGLFAWGGYPLATLLLLGNKEELQLSYILARMELKSVRLVALSACETGVTDPRWFVDEFVGLPGAFLQIGAKAVLSSLWMVEDESTALLMERFYQNHLQSGMSIPAALRDAQKWLRDEVNSGQYSHPYYWAPFTLLGHSS
jgi:CHAT domain-containing protein